MTNKTVRNITNHVTAPDGTEALYVETAAAADGYMLLSDVAAFIQVVAVITQVTPSLLATVKGIANTPVENDVDVPIRVGDNVLVGQIAGTWTIVTVLTGRVPAGVAIAHRAKGTTDPAHIFTIDPLNPGAGITVYPWSQDPLYHSWWIRPSPDGRHILMMRALVADVGANFEDSYTTSSVWMANANGTNFRKIIQRPADMTNPDGSIPLAHGTPFWVDNEHFVMFRGPIKTGTSSGYVLFDLEGNFKKVILAVNGISYTDCSYARVPQTLPLVLTGTDTNVRQVTGTTVNGTTGFTTSGTSPNVLTQSGDAGRFILGPGIAPGTYIVSVTNASTAVLSANSGAAAGSGLCLLSPETTTVVSTGYTPSLDPDQLYGCIHGAAPAGQVGLGEVFRFPLRQLVEAGVGGLPSSFYQVTASSKTLTALTTSAGTTAVSGIAPALTATDVNKFITGPGIVNGTTVFSQTGTSCVLSQNAVNGANGVTGNNAGAGAGGVYYCVNFDPVASPMGSHVFILSQQTYDSPAGGYGIRCSRVDQGQSGSGGVKPKTLIGFTTTDGGTPDIADNAGNYVSRADCSKELQANGKYRIMTYRYVNSAGSALSWDDAASAPYVALIAFDWDPATNTASNPRTIWHDDHVVGLPYQTPKVAG